MSLLCQKCLCTRTGDVAGQPCRTPGCDGTVEVQPPFSDLVDELPEPMTCGRRTDNGMQDENSVFKGSGTGLDRWQRFKTNGNRVCSYCGSLHPDDMFELVRAAIAAPDDATLEESVTIEQSDKPYKIYVRQPGVRNAHEGGIKFYTHHLPRDVQGVVQMPDERNEEFALAIRASKRRFDQYLARTYPKK